MSEDSLKNFPIKEIYQDVAQPAARQIGKALESTAKAARFLLVPVEYIAAWRDRWEHYLVRISEKVPEENLVAADSEVIGPVLLNLQFSKEDSIQAEMFLNLLALAIDRTKVSEVHPAYGHITAQLHPDEALILYHLKKRGFILEEKSDLREDHTFGPRIEIRNEFPISELIYGRKFRFYLDHLYHLSLASITQIGNQQSISNESGHQIGTFIRSRIGLMSFGYEFAKACVPDELPHQGQAGAIR